MDTATTARPDFRDHHNQDSALPFQHSYPGAPHSQPQQHYSHTTPFSQPLAQSSTLQPFLSSNSHQPLPQPFPRHHDHQRQTPAPLPTASPALSRPFSQPESLRHTLPQPPVSQPHSSLYQPQFKPLPHPEPAFPDSKQTHTTTNRSRLPTSKSQPSRRTPLPRQTLSSDHHEERAYPASAPSFPPPSAPLTSLDKKPQPFPFSKSLPYPLGHPPQPPSKPASTVAQTTTTTTTPPTATPTPQPAPLQQSATPPSPTRAQPTLPVQEQGPLYDIAKLLAAHCTILSGKVYNDKGHNICGVLNQHDKPCKRIGKCPFHGAHKPVTAENSVNGNIDASGTVATPSTSPDGTNTPPGQTNAYGNRSPGGSNTTVVNGSKPKIPPKQQYKHGWSKEEHFLFLGGLNQHGKGSWKQIACVVKTRTPTQVQSHAQKFFQRQKQTDKNKRSIHDLSLDSPEMIEVAKKLKTSGTKISLPGSGLGEPIAIANVADAGAFRGHGVAITPPALTLNHSTLPTDNVGRGLLNDTGLGRFGTNVQSPLDSKFGHVQATSATTLGSLNSGVQISHIPGASHNRPFPPTQTSVGQPELFGQLNQGTINTGPVRRPSDNRLPMKMEGTPGRDVILNSVRPAFMQDPYQGNTNTPLMPGQHLLGAKQSLYGNQNRTTGGLHGNETTATADPGTTHAAYSANALQGLYRQIGGNSSVFPQGRSGTDTQLQWGYDNDTKARRQREMNAANRDFHLQNTQLSTTLQGISQIPLSDHLGGATGIANDHSVDQPFDGSHQNQGNAFAGGIFAGSDSVEVDTNMYGVSSGQANTVQVPGRLGTNVSGYPQPTGVHMGQMPLQTTFGGGANAYHRND